MKNLIASAIIILLIATACSKERLTANGNIITETRDVTGFTAINTSGAHPIEITYGTSFYVEIKGSSNLVPYFKSYVINGQLYLKFEGANVSKDDISVKITMPVFKGVSSHGSSKININGSFPAVDQIKVSTSGSGDIIVKDNIVADFIDIEISGSSLVDFKKVSSKQTKANISGSGNIYVATQDRLEASISGSGNVYYIGNPVIDEHVSGSGRVIKY
jgi:hypothetical protein